MITSRAQLLDGLLGKPWRANSRGPDAYDCWHLAAAVSLQLFQRPLPAIAVPTEPSWAWMITTIREHPERAHWRQCADGPVVIAKDGAIVLMSRTSRPAHTGIWLAAERAVIHADPTFGVVLDSLVQLRTGGSWRRLQFFEPLDAA